MKKLFTFLLVGVFCLSLSAQSNITISSSCDNATICNTSNDCGNMFAELTVAATTDCSTSSDLTFTYQIDLFDDGSNDLSDDLATASQDFPQGTHRITFTISDECNTSETCDYLFEIKDCTLPIPVCIFGIATTVMPASGDVTINAADFESGMSSDNCTALADLHLSFSPDINNTSITIDCDILPADGLYPITLYVTDAAGNADFCSTFVNVQDPSGACDSTGGTITTGLVYTIDPQDCDIEDMEYSINGSPNSLPGSFLISTLNIGDQVTPFKNNNYLNGVTTYDLVLISKHVLNLQQFDQPWQLLAADANQNGAITTLDIIILRALILQNITQFPNGSSWAFSPSSFVYDGVMPDFEFLGVKIGDVNGTASMPNCFQAPVIDTRTLETLNLTTKNQLIKVGKTYTITTFAHNYEKIIGGQFTIEFNATALEFQSIEGNNSIELNEENFGKNLADDGFILCSWNTSASQNLNVEDTFFNITFTAKKDGRLSDYLTINSKKINAEIYVEDGTNMEFWNAELSFENKQFNNTFTISPNPFSEKTIFNFSLENLGNVELEIFDTNGRLVFSQQKNMPAGENQIEILKANLLSNGIYFYKIKTDNNVNTGKIISQ
ncbi:MAG: T9SS type A sorting domain-containing protein [Saprospiraceae bacterium]